MHGHTNIKQECPLVTMVSLRTQIRRREFYTMNNIGLQKTKLFPKEIKSDLYRFNVAEQNMANKMLYHPPILRAKV